MKRKTVRKLSYIFKLIISFAIISISIFFQNNNFYLQSTKLLKTELENISFDTTALTITMRQLMNSYNIALLILLILLCALYLFFSNKNKCFNILEKIFFLSMIGLIILVLIFSTNIENLHLYPLIIFVFCILSLLPFPNWFLFMIQIVIYLYFSILIINNIYCLLNWKKQSKSINHN